MTAEPNRRILLVEDEPVLALTERLSLERYGYLVTTASSGEEAVALVGRRLPFDLVLMDIDLGAGIDGTVAAEEIGKIVDLPVLFLSAHTEPEVVAKTERITSYGYVVKGSNITVLDASIKMAFKLFRANKLVRESEARLNRSEKVSKTGNWMITLADRKIVGSEGARAIYGLESTELSYEDVHRMVLPEFRKPSEEAMTDLIQRNIPYRVRSRIRRESDGAVLDLLSVAEYDPATNSVYGVIQDITGRTNEVRPGED